MVSFGHAAYLGIGAYAVALGARWGVTDLLAQILLGIGDVGGLCHGDRGRSACAPGAFISS